MEERIREAVRRSPFTQTEVGHRLGLSQPAVSARLTGRTRWTLAEIVELARLLGMTVDELIGDDELPIGYALTEKAAS